jgi:hypothetical protein
MNPDSHKEWRRMRLLLLRRCGFWGITLPLLTLALSIIYTDSLEQRIIMSALFVAAGFFAVASSVGLLQGIAAALLIFIGAFLGSIAFSWSIAVAVAMIGIVKLQRLNKKYGKDPLHL